MGGRTDRSLSGSFERYTAGGRLPYTHTSRVSFTRLTFGSIVKHEGATGRSIERGGGRDGAV